MSFRIVSSLCLVTFIYSVFGKRTNIGNTLQNVWDKIYDMGGGDPYNLTVCGLLILMTVLYWGYNAFFVILDTTGSPQFLKKYKIQPDQNNPLSNEKLMKAVLVVGFNFFVVGFPVQHFMFYAYDWRGNSCSRELPPFETVVWNLVGCLAFEEIFFYYSHRLLHHPKLYKHIHKIHHEWTSPVGVSAAYAHPVEHIVANVMPLNMGPFLTGCHVSVTWLWFSILLVVTSIFHSGYHFPFTWSSEEHDYHHLKFNNNFGTLGILDWLHGTDENFRKSKAFQRHTFLTGFTPASVLYPDDKEKRK